MWKMSIQFRDLNTQPSESESRPGLSPLTFFFSKVNFKQLSNAKIADDWIRAVDHWDRKTASAKAQLIVTNSVTRFEEISPLWLKV